ncbi:DUF1624 domain-containing protein [Acinetobacter kanungonis]|uniref:DUF1624 domain-containing protein n=1 Tax=Acinetobacter kanungonis TaxID=2699469 RepID=UPI001379DD53|nr:heparan-alpha-glucosaminide N-acetyltransferase domain-containing protein [Acinetobacter kanungonis]NCI79724.1 DUF1624 domain-containing protein [Acinetobacter kanungonis]
MSALSQRLQAIDALRGLVILIMMVDHVRETFYLHHQVPDPMNIEQTEASLFFSRILAHLCAPIFVVLTGLSAYLYQAKHNSLRMTREFLLKRGLFLVVLELLVINFAWTGQFPPQVIYLQVIWAIGISMMALALLIGLPQKILWLMAVLIIFGHNWLDQLSSEQFAGFAPLWLILHERGWIEIGEFLKLRTSYPVLPWIGVIVLGYAFGSYLFQPSITVQQRNKRILGFACGSLLLFFILRSINFYGDLPWQIFPTSLQTLMSFFNLTKYPPSLSFILWNLGVGLLLLLALEKVQHRAWVRPLIIFGSVPMFFYIVHLMLLKLLYLFAVAVWGQNHGDYFGVSQVASLWWIAIALSIVLYPLMYWFSKFKHQNKQITLLKYF